MGGFFIFAEFFLSVGLGLTRGANLLWIGIFKSDEGLGSGEISSVGLRDCGSILTGEGPLVVEMGEGDGVFFF